MKTGHFFKLILWLESQPCAPCRAPYQKWYALDWIKHMQPIGIARLDRWLIFSAAVLLNISKVLNVIILFHYFYAILSSCDSSDFQEFFTTFVFISVIVSPYFYVLVGDFGGAARHHVPSSWNNIRIWVADCLNPSVPSSGHALNLQATESICWLVCFKDTFCIYIGFQ